MMRREARLAGVIALIVIICAAIVASCVAGCGREEPEVIARVGNDPITQQQLWKALEKADNGEAGRQTLDALIVRRLIRQEAAKRDIEVSREELESRMEGLKDYILAATGKDFETWLEDSGQTEEDIASRISVQILTGKLVLTDEDREKFFEENKDRLADLPHNNESVIYREIVVGSEEEAEAVRKELLDSASQGVVSGEQFAEVAEARSLDPFSARRGGMAGWMVKGKSSDPRLEEVLFAVEPGQISEPIPFETASEPDDQESAESEESAEEKGPEYWRIVMVEKHVTPHEMTLEDNADIIEEFMLDDPRFQAQLQEYFTNMRARADIEILAPRYKSLAEAYRAGREAREQRLSDTTELTPMAPAGAPQPQPEQPVPEALGE